MSYASKEQLLEIVKDLASKVSVPTIGVGGGFAPVGTIIAYMGTTAPQDYLACDGSTKNIADYQQLADFFAAQFGSVNYFGGNGTTTFAVPDLRGEFLRGTGTNSHTNQGSGENVGVHQDATEHTTIIADGDALIGEVGLRALFNTDFIDQYGNMKTQKTDSSINSPTANAKFNDFKLDSIGTSSGKGAYFTSKPTNTSVLYCIKYNAAGEVYSTIEREVGTWIDGKPIYQKTFTGTITATEAVVNLASINFKKIVEFNGTFGSNSAGISQINYLVPSGSSFNGCYAYILNNVLHVGESNRTNDSYIITLRYTKTTD